MHFVRKGIEWDKNVLKSLTDEEMAPILKQARKHGEVLKMYKI